MTSTLSRDEWLETDDRHAPLNAAIDALLDASRGWPLTARRTEAGHVAGSDAREIAVQRLLDELGAELGLYLPADDQARLRRSPATDPEEFTNMLFQAAGLEPAHHPHLRRQARDRVRRRLG